jgi:hypothetical protein
LKQQFLDRHGRLSVGRVLPRAVCVAWGRVLCGHGALHQTCIQFVTSWVKPWEKMDKSWENHVNISEHGDFTSKILW